MLELELDRFSKKAAPGLNVFSRRSSNVNLTNT